VILLSYFKSVKWANRLAVAHTSLTIGASIFLLVFWAISVGIFNVHSKSSTSDLWSWSCEKADDTEKYVINWGQYCLEQVTPFGYLIQSWCSVCGILSIAFEFLTLVTFFLIFLRRRSKRQVRESRQYSTVLRSVTSPQEQQYRQPLRSATHGSIPDEHGQWVFVPNPRGSASKLSTPIFAQEVD
jgi:hypothetical protein